MKEKLTTDFLSVNNLRCGYSNGFTIKGANISVSKGSFVGIIGRNGSGKTTLFKGIMCDIPHISGSVILNGTSTKKMSIRDRSKEIAVVSQFPDLYDITVEEYVLMGRMPYRQKWQFFDSAEDLKIAHYYMDMTDTLQWKDRNIMHLSGGQQQMVSIASALTQQPQLLLLDEPTSHLDISHQIGLMNIIKSLCLNSNLTAIMIIHDLSFAAEYCDYIVLMQEGDIFKQGTPEEVITKENINKVYNTDVDVIINARTGRPMVFPTAQLDKKYMML